MVLAIGFLLIVSLVVSAIVSSSSQVIGTYFGGAEVLAHGLDLLVSFLLVTALFAMIYEFLPDVKIEWRESYGSALLLHRYCLQLGNF